jgi:hypothetical protein
MRRKTSNIWSISDEQFIERVKTCRSMAELLRTFSLQNKGNNFKTAKRRIEELSIDSSHFLSAMESSIVTRTMSKEKFMNILESGKRITNTNVKKFILKFDLIKNECKSCGLSSEWNGKKLVLQLEHMDGNSINNKLNNLCFLCPNCHSQTDTFAGKKLKKYYKCSSCGQNICKNDKCCYQCSGKKRRLAMRPDKEQLIEIIKKEPMETIAHSLGLKTGNTIKKWCVEYNINFKEISPYSRMNRSRIKEK